jgi:rRNA maturation protein Nop10
MAYRCEIECPCCGGMHVVDVPSRFACVRSAYVTHRDLLVNHVGRFRRLSQEIQKRCPTTRRFYHLLCTRTYARN